MEKLKSVIADKIIEVSSNNDDNVRLKLEKINRFRDFADACRTLMKKYPDIENELICLVENNDFDTKVAASRVDSIIRLSENQKSEDISELEEIKAKDIIDGEPIPVFDNSGMEIQNESAENIISDYIPQQPIYTSEEPKQIETDIPEEVDYEEVISENGETVEKGEYIDYEEIVTPEEEKTAPLLTEAEEDQPAIKIRSKQNETIKKVIQVLIAVVIIVALIFLIVFVIKNWKLILYILGGIIVAGIIIRLLIKKFKNK